MADKKQVIRFNDAELSLMKSTFAENDALLQAMRSVFVQLPLTKTQEDMIRMNFGGKSDLLKLMRKVFLPELDAEAPLNQMIDLWMTVDLKDKTPDEAVLVLVARARLLVLIEQALKGLEDVTYVPEVKLSGFLELENLKPEDIFANFIARNSLITHTEVQLRQLLTLAGKKDETIEKTLENIQKNSTK